MPLNSFSSRVQGRTEAANSLRPAVSINFYTSIIVLMYLAGTYILFLNHIFGGASYLINLNHAVFFCLLLITQRAQRFPFPRGGILVFGIFFSYILVSKLIHSYEFGELNLKSELIFMFSNFCLGYIFSLKLIKLNPRELKKFAYVYYMLSVVIAFIFLFHYSSANKYSLIFIEYPDGWHDSYQTLSAYLFRYLMAGVMIYTLKTSNLLSDSGSRYIFLISAIFGVMSLFSVSKKETAIFILLAVILYNHGARCKIRAIVFSCSAFALFAYNFSDILVFYINLVERSLLSRAEIIDNDFYFLLANVNILGSPYIYDLLNVNYPHSFTLSMLISYGFLGVILSWSCVIYVLYMLWKKNAGKVMFFLVLAMFCISNFATHFDYMVLWYLFGLSLPIMFLKRKFESP